MVGGKRAGARSCGPTSAPYIAPRKLIWLLTCLICAPWPYALALNRELEVSRYAHTAWRFRDGFTKGEIRAIAQTPDGFLWLGTDFGLVRFDGVRTDSWQPPPGGGLPDRRIRTLFVARDGGLWIGTSSGLASWSHGKLVTYPQLDGWAVNGFTQDRQGTLWVGATGVTADGTGRLCAIRSSGTECYGSDRRFGAAANSVLEDRHSNLWVAATNGVWRWRPGPPQLNTLSDPAMGFQSLAETSSGGILALTLKGIDEIIDGKVREYWVAPVGAGWRPLAIFKDRDGALWIGNAGRGLIHLHDGRMDEFGASDGLSGDFVITLFEDHEANIWVATDEGLDRFRALAATTYSPRQGVVGLNNSVLADRDGSLWFTTTAALYHWADGRFTAYRSPGKPLFEASSRSSAQTPLVNEIPVTGFPEAAAASLFQDHRGRLWLGMVDGFGYLERNRFVSIDGVPHGYIDSIVEDPDGNLWIAHRDAGLLELTSDRVVRQIPWTNMIRSSPGWTRLAIDPVNGGLWVGFYSGVVVHLVDGQVRASYGAGDGLAKGYLNKLRVAPDGTVWVASGGGLSRLRAGHIATLNTRTGLPCDDVDSSIEDDGSLWLYTACGLVHIAAADLQSWAAEVGDAKSGQSRVPMTVLDDSDGVRSFDFLSTFAPHIARTPDGRLWLTAVDGLTVVDPHHTPFNKLPPPVHVERLVADRTPYESSAPLQLPPRVRDLEVSYTALSLVAPEKIQFRYMLVGRDREWQEAGNRRSAFYTDLPPGSYQFHVIASNNSGVWNTKGAALDFSIAPAYWQTTWFRALCVLAFLGFLWALYELRLRQVKRVFNMTLEARVGERNRVARELHDTLLQSFQGLLLRFRTVHALFSTRPEEARRILEGALDDAREALTEGRQAVQGLRSSAADSQEFEEAIRTLAEELATEAARGHTVELRLNVEGTSRALRPLIRDEIYRIASEALRNAYRHAEASRIEVHLDYGERRFELRVRDNGKGIDPEFIADAALAGHFGLRGMRERAKEIGGKFTIWSAPGSGTELELSVPGAMAYGSTPRTRYSWLTGRSSAAHTKEES